MFDTYALQLLSFVKIKENGKVAIIYDSNHISAPSYHLFLYPHLVLIFDCMSCFICFYLSSALCFSLSSVRAPGKRNERLQFGFAGRRLSNVRCPSACPGLEPKHLRHVLHEGRCRRRRQVSLQASHYLHGMKQCETKSISSTPHALVKICA